jgi:response regulator of citrate/malate metabolism
VDLILLNPALPDKNGFDMVTHLGSVPPTIVLADRMDYAYYAYRIGAFDYRIKPLSADQFESSLERVFRAVRQSRELAKAKADLEHLRGQLLPSSPNP